MTRAATPACLGLIVPPRAGEVPADGPALYGDRVRFIARGLGLAEISTRGYEEVIDHVVELAADLAANGAQALSLMGTSLSFFRGARFNAELEAEMARRTGLPCTTMSNAIVRGMRALGLRRVAVATAYIDEVNDRLAAYLGASELVATTVKGLAITGVVEVGQVPTDTLVALCEEVYRARPGSEGILISCGGLLTLDAIGIVEARLGVPVVSSSPAGFWDLMRVAGLDSRSVGHGRLFEI
ncbi:MAG TPA: arylmalonate decarboxylase [Caldimonas sp.]